MKAVSAKTRRKRMRKLASKIVKHEDKLDMRTWFEAGDLDMNEETLLEKILEKRRPICGTAACAAGWAVFMFGSKKQIRECVTNDGDWSDTARDLLGMTEAEAGLFQYTSHTAAEVAQDLRSMAGQITEV
jgi:hypothetical protein